MVVTISIPIATLLTSRCFFYTIESSYRDGLLGGVHRCLPTPLRSRSLWLVDVVPSCGTGARSELNHEGSSLHIGIQLSVMDKPHVELTYGGLQWKADRDEEPRTSKGGQSELQRERGRCDGPVVFA